MTRLSTRGGMTRLTSTSIIDMVCILKYFVSMISLQISLIDMYRTTENQKRDDVVDLRSFTQGSTLMIYFN